MANKIYYSKTGRTGGAAIDLDSIDGASLVDGDWAHVAISGMIEHYKLKDGSTSPPGSFPPATNPGTKRWELQYAVPLFASAAQIIAGTETAKAIAPDQLLAAGIMPQPNRNIIINGGFTINQRAYDSAAALATTVYGHDRWKGGSGGGTYSFTQLASPTLITIAANKTLIQVVEDKNVYGGTYILSWAGTAQARYAINSATPAGSYAASPIIITGQTPGTTMSIEFNAGTLGNVQLELGSVVTPFEFRPFAQELALCLRYFCKSYNYATAPAAATYAGTIMYSAIITIPASTAGGIVGSCRFPVAMRATPTLVISDRGGTAGSVRTGAGALRGGVTDAGYLSMVGFNDLSVNNTDADAITAPTSIEFHFTAAAEL